MRTLMLLGSLAMIGSGIFSFANGSAAFISVAFVVGVVFVAMGIIEAIVGSKTDADVFGSGANLTTDGITMFLFGVVMLSGQITDDVTAQMLFALWLLTEALLGIGGKFKPGGQPDAGDNWTLVLGVAMLAVAMYTFFNTRLLNINAIILIGASVMLLGLRRFVAAFDIEYNKPGFMSGNSQRLEEALEEEKRAMAKAKEGIKEQKLAQRRVEKIKEEMLQERDAMTETTLIKLAIENADKGEEKE